MRATPSSAGAAFTLLASAIILVTLTSRTCWIYTTTNILTLSIADPIFVQVEMEMKKETLEERQKRNKRESKQRSRARRREAKKKKTMKKAG